VVLASLRAEGHLVSLKAFIGMCVTGMLIFVSGLHIPLWLNPFWPSYYFGGFIMSILFTYSIVKEKIVFGVPDVPAGYGFRTGASYLLVLV
jgi:hypothetical protein